MRVKTNFLIFILILFLTATIAAKKVSVEFKIGDETKKIKVDTNENLESIIEKEFPGYGTFNNSELKEGNVYELKPLVTITIVDGGVSKKIKTPLSHVAEILNYACIKLEEKDLVIPSMEKIPEDNKISIFRITEKIVERQEASPIKTIERLNPNLKPGTEKIVQEGKVGLKKLTKKEKYVNGKLSSATTIKEEVITPDEPKIIEKGKPLPEVLTRGQNLRSFTMVATAYEAGPGSTGKRPGDRGYGITASGTRARRGAVAVDPRVIPLGTKLYIKSLDPNIPDYGYAIAEDTGGAIKGHRIDLFMNTVAECFQFGRRKVIVYILPKDTPGELFN